MQVVFRVADVELDLELDVGDPTVSVGELVRALADGPVRAGVGLLADGRWLPPDAALVDVALLRGTVLELADGPPDPAPSALAWAEVSGGLEAGRRFPLPPGRHLVGRGAAARVRLASPTVSARHAALDVTPSGCAATDLGSTNGVRVGQDFRTRLAVQPTVPLQLGAVRMHVRPPAHDTSAAAATGSGGTAPFSRPPRPADPAPLAPLALPSPLRPAGPPPRFAWPAAVVPLVAGVVMALLWSPLLLGFAGFAVLMVTGNWLDERRRARKDRRVEAQRLSSELAALDDALAVAADLHRRSLETELPDLAETVRRATQPSTRLWERRPGHPRFLALRLGVGTLRWQPPLAGEPHAAAAEAQALLDRRSRLEEAPVGADLADQGVLGVAGPRTAALAVARALVCQAAVHQGPADVRIAVVSSDHDVWDWVKWLPHAAQPEALRTAADEAARGLLVIDLPGAGPAHAEAHAALDTPGSRGVVVAGSVDRLPARCTRVLALQDADGHALLTAPGTPDPPVPLLADGCSADTARTVAVAVGRWTDPEARHDAALPDDVRLLALLGLATPSEPAVTQRWSRGGSPTAQVGLTAGGVLQLDLVGDGPHALVAGTTGAGKSELLRTLVAGLAAGASPEDLTFILVDYKGGSAFDACARLPHTVGLVTDLDEHLGARALVCLEAELRERERRLRAAGVADLPAYQALRSRDRSLEPFPRLVVVIDEFATLAAELPEFMDALVGVAQRGRSLGMHLVLATQRPAGAVSETIRANTNIRVALRVQDRADSVDVLGSPEAAGLDRRSPGRGFVLLGPEELQAFQAAHVSAPARRAGSRISLRPFSAVDTPAPQDDSAGPTDLELLVDAAVAAFAASGSAAPRRPWPDPLPARVPLADLDPRQAPRGAGVVGLADEPARQRQRPWTWDLRSGHLLCCGATGSGAAESLLTVAAALAANHGPDELHLYAVDHGRGRLTGVGNLPHCGAVLAAADLPRQRRLLGWLRAELDRRRAAPDVVNPVIVVLIDGYSGLQAAFDDVAGMSALDDLARVVADGPALGVVVAAAADRSGSVPASVAMAVANKLVFRLADPLDYAAFGVSPRDVPDLAEGQALDAASGLLVRVADPDLALARAGPAAQRPPVPVRLLPEQVTRSVLAGWGGLSADEWALPLGLADSDLQPTGLRLAEGEHALVTGPARSGKSTTLTTIAVQGARAGEVTAITSRRSPLRGCPAITRRVEDPAALAGVVAAVLAARAPQLILVDDADLLEDPSGAMANLLSAPRPGVHVVAAGRADGLRAAYGHWTQAVRRSRQGLLLRPHVDFDGDLLQTTLPRHGPTRMGPGRGYLVRESVVELVQVAC